MYIELQSNKKTINVTVKQLYLYKQSKVMEAFDEHNNYYYLVFYKDTYMNGMKTDHIKLNSHIHQAFTSGIRIDAEHPIIHHLTKNEKLPLIRFNQLYKKVQQDYSPIETALIFTFFDSFTAEGSATQLLKKTFYDFRRNGKMLKAFQVLKLLAAHDQKNQFAKDMLENMQFQRYATQYQDYEQLVKIDPLYLESSCFTNLENKIALHYLLMLLHTENRWIDTLIIRTHLLKNKFEEMQWNALEQSLKTFTINEQITLLFDIYQSSQHADIEKALTNKLIGSSHHNDLVVFIMEHNYQPQENQLDQIVDHLTQADPKVISSYFNHSNQQLVQLSKHLTAKQIETLITPFIKTFLEDYSISEVRKWFTPFHEVEHHFSIEQTLTKMNNLQDDPDNQFLLGELYIKFNQFEKAIDCFKWEIELSPNSTQAIQALANLYKQLGNHTEAKTYQNLLIQTQKYG
ncbi:MULTISPECIES: hypothetical protein [Paraliobacillus]|uniref:hypothetical protein n=1 Tax=Paraliobacillus TaxID=200903 RepID=UPI001300A2B3|nr:MULTISPECIES: hypothetical protein [Paraliobacillus]